MKLRLVSDGTTHGTRVESEHGEKVERVQAVQWEIDTKTHRATVTVTFGQVEVDIRDMP